MSCLTERQRIFVEKYALTGRARESAIAAGTSPASAHTRAYRWLNKPAVSEPVEMTRLVAFEDLRERIARQMIAAIHCHIPGTLRALDVWLVSGVRRGRLDTRIKSA